ncbi:PREDICTED: disease resistance-like protein CSA1 [Camelina sativa]|uniref:ADP-ribosyl cyclase/cyclic ADP-ribose hydrolase n=1 Tax=Camelina sativa TaxID=90675 RepID=A0ABM0XYC5_CAMSA|nr:PREDICTED: disease resistance-like protein CSA1 [Camelina sativa]
MPCIGKSTLARKLYEKLKDGFLSYTLIPDVHEISKKDGLSYLLTILLEDLLNVKDPNIETVQAAHQVYKDQLLRTKVFVVLDNVTSKDQIDALLGKRDWIKPGSKIVIATRDKSLIQSFVDDIYEVPGLSARDALQHFVHYAFHDQEGSALRQGNFSKLSNDFVHYTKGNPLALKILGTELFGKNETHWDLKLKALDHHHISPLGHSWLQKVWEGSYDGLSQQEKDMLLDIACFRSLDENYLVSLLESDDTRNIMEDLVNMFMININAGKVQMHDTLYMLSKVLGQKATATDGKGRHRLWHHQTITDMLKNNKGACNVRSVFLDLSDITRKMSFHSSAFAKMRDLRYLKIYSTNCSRDCDHDIKDDTKLNFPEGIQLPLNEVRCLHWLKFPWKELPQDFNPFNLVDLKLPYSKIERVWEDNKDAPKLKWVNLNHSKKLNTLAGLGKAQNLQELNLEGCTALKQLHVDMQNMKCLVFLNLRGCTSLKSLPDIQLISLKTLILSDCTKFKEFQVISSKLEVIYLDGTAIKELKFDIEFFQSLVFLNMKGCKKLKRLPDNLGELKALEELILSGCSKLKTFPEIGGNRSRLGILLLDETAIEETPKIVSVRRLCLSKNEKISRLPNLINQFPQLQWLDLKYCKNLTQVPQPPPNLQCLDVRGCNSLKTIVKPLVCSRPMKHINSTFIFTECNELEQAAKEEISSYAERKCQLLSSALKHCDESCVPEILSCTSFPGCEMPSWFSHGAIGSMVEFELPPHWNHNRLSGIALCVVVSFQNCQNHANLTVRFSCAQNNGKSSCTNITWKVGSLIEQDSKVNTVELDHVLIGYTNCSSFIKLVEGQSPRKCAPTKALLEFRVTTGTGGGGESRFEVLKSGFSFVFEPEENRVPFARNDDVKGKTKINGTRSANGCFKDQAYGDESPKGQWQTKTYIESSTYIPDEASSSQTSGIDSTLLY